MTTTRLRDDTALDVGSLMPGTGWRAAFDAPVTISRAVHDQLVYRPRGAPADLGTTRLTALIGRAQVAQRALATSTTYDFPAQLDPRRSRVTWFTIERRIQDGAISYFIHHRDDGRG